jgi:hypothetical protein
MCYFNFFFNVAIVVVISLVTDNQWPVMQMRKNVFIIFLTLVFLGSPKRDYALCNYIIIPRRVHSKKVFYVHFIYE